MFRSHPGGPAEEGERVLYGRCAGRKCPTSNASVDLFVDTGIAAADVICCSRLGVYAAGENHNEAVALLEKAEPSAAKYLRTLLNLKSKVAYTHQSVTTDEHKKPGRAAENLV
jgi:hypothetical protein